jgi:hypothetical protein
MVVSSLVGGGDDTLNKLCCSSIHFLINGKRADHREAAYFRITRHFMLVSLQQAVGIR